MAKEQKAKFTNCSKRRKRLGIEKLEDRSMLTLLGISPDFPLTAYDSLGTVDYDSGTQAFSLDADPTSFLQGPIPFFFPKTVTGTSDFTIDIVVNNSGVLVGGVAGNDLVLIGDIDIDGDSTVDVSGTLLTGDVTAFGYFDTGTATDNYDFRFTATGGAYLTGGSLSGGGTWGPFFSAEDIGVTTNSSNSDFGGVFTSNFSGDASGNIGEIEQLEGGGAVPEPSTFVQAAVGAASMGLLGWRRRNRRNEKKFDRTESQIWDDFE